MTELISIVIPTYNEEACLAATLTALRSRCPDAEIIVSDGGSVDRTVEIAASYGVQIIAAKLGRGQQLAAGAQSAKGEILWFLHADTIPGKAAYGALRSAMEDDRVVCGNFKLTFDGSSGNASTLTWIYPRLRWLGLAYGDSGIFARKKAYEKAGGFRDFPIFEDLDFIHRIKRTGIWKRLDAEISTSSRRFESKNFALMFAYWSYLQILYWCGVSPVKLGAMYKHVRGTLQSASSEGSAASS